MSSEAGARNAHSNRGQPVEHREAPTGDVDQTASIFQWQILAACHVPMNQNPLATA
jgi:hypothetical protein